MKEKNEKNLRNADSAVIPPELAAKAKAGDQAAFTELYELSYRKLYRTIHSMVRDEDLAWDILQDSYIRAWRGLDKLESGEAFLPWLRRIAVNVTATQMAQKRTLTFTDLAGDEDEGAVPDIPDLNMDNQPELALDRQETSRLVREILAELPEAQQMILGMHYYEDMPIKEIAETLRIAPGTVKVQLFRGRKKVETAVRALEKRGLKLYGLSPLPFLLALLRRLEPGQAAEQKALAAVLAEAPAAGAAAGGSAVTLTAMTAGQAFLQGLAGKLVVGALAVSLIGCGIWAGGKLLREPDVEIGNYQPAETRMTSDPEIPTETEDPSQIEVSSETDEDLDSQTPTEGVCGETLSWSFDPETGLLSFFGYGSMDVYKERSGPDAAPWSPFRSQITAVSFPEGLSSIGSLAFYGCTELTEMELPESLDLIGRISFGGCSGLRSLQLPEKLTTIAFNAFENCTGITELYLPGQLTLVEDHAFVGCTGLRSLTVSEGATNLQYNCFSGCTSLTDVTVLNPSCYIEDSCFDRTPGLRFTGYLDSTVEAYAEAHGAEFISLGFYPADNYYQGACGENLSWSFDRDTGALTLTGSGPMDTMGGEGAPWYAYREKIVKLDLPAGLTEIGAYAFSECTGLRSVAIPEGVTVIGAYAFSECTGLRSVAIPEGVTVIGYRAFGDCKELQEVSLPKSLTRIDDYVFCDCDKLSTINFPENLTYIGENAFWFCASLPSAELPEGLSTLGEAAFGCCEGLRSVTIPGSLTSISPRAFDSCTGLESLTISEGVIHIGWDAFWGASNLRSLTIPKSVSSVEDGAFCRCKALTEISVAEGNPAFLARDGVLFSKDGTKLIQFPAGRGGSYSVPLGVSAIGGSAFAGCSELHTLTLPDGLRSIGSSAFVAAGLTSLRIPGSVTEIGDGAFLGCVELRSVELSESLDRIPECCFDSCAALSAVTIPDSVTEIGRYAFQSCTALSELTIPDSVTAIEDLAFIGCVSLTEAAIPASVTSIGEEAFGWFYDDQDRIRLQVDFTISGSAGSEAERYANENGIPFAVAP